MNLQGTVQTLLISLDAILHVKHLRFRDTTHGKVRALWPLPNLQIETLTGRDLFSSRL